MKTNREIAEYTLEALKKAGADHAQCIVANGVMDEINADGGEFSLMRTLFNSSVSMKALKDGERDDLRQQVRQGHDRRGGQGLHRGR